MAKKMSTKELLFYKEYHNNPINKLIHVICIPLIAVTLGNLCTYLIPVNALSGFLKGDTILSLLYIYIYHTGWPNKIAKIMTVWMIIICVIGRYFRYARPETWVIESFYIHVASWVLQFIGHAIEGRKPALFDSLKQAFVQAPVFSLEPYIPGMFE